MFSGLGERENMATVCVCACVCVCGDGDGGGGGGVHWPFAGIFWVAFKTDCFLVFQNSRYFWEVLCKNWG